MPANLGPDYLAAEQEYRHAETTRDKIAALEKMFATLPKHKGTEKMQADIKRKLSQARKESQKKGASHAPPFYLIPKEGAGQVVLLGPPNSGKSSLVAALTHARPEVADYPFTTRLPMPGMMHFENVQIQLVDLPPVSEEFSEVWMPQTVRAADAGVLVLDVNDPALLDSVEFIEARLVEWRAKRPALLAGSKVDAPGGWDNLRALDDLYSGRYRVVGFSTRTAEGLDGLARAVFEMLELVRVYTKAPGKKADLSAPYVLRRGETVLDAARHVHRDFAEHLKFARLYHKDGGLEGLLVDRHHPVQDEDVLEFHM
jgi:ribosome-interacting GTPase 1